jgi:hypothetical protein
MSDRIVGYLVMVMPRDGFTDPSHVFTKKVLFPTWTEAVAHCTSIARPDIAAICLIRASSQGDCARWQNVKIYELTDGAAVYVQAVFAPAI